MLQPNNIKFRKNHLYFSKGNENRCHILHFGIFGLKSLSEGHLSSSQIEIIRKILLKFLRNNTNNVMNKKKRIPLWIRIFPNNPITSIGLESRIGKGKGNVVIWSAYVRPGQILFEFNTSSQIQINKIMKYISTRLPIHIVLIKSFDFLNK